MAQQNNPYLFPDLGGNYSQDPNAPYGATAGWRMDHARADGVSPFPSTSVRAKPDPSGVAPPSSIQLGYNLKKNQKMPSAPKSKKQGGRRRDRRRTRKHVPWKGWSKQEPSTAQRTKMLRRCGKKCFLGPKKSFPVCKKNTCKISSKGLWAAYIRAKEWGKKRSSYRGKGHPTMKRRVYTRVANKSRNMLRRRGFKVGK